MGKSYRIKATPGKDQNIVLQVDQDFEQLEILSLKIRQSDIFLRMCSETGIVAGRVFANNGYGIPNAKLSIFVPVTDEDLKNPTIESLYPYKKLEQVNEDGYRYNLLPYLPSYDGHTPTGTFPSRTDNLINQTVVQLYDKYYKYTVQTNESGDYMIYGVPLGSQTLVMNVDLSDIGEFSLGPQDLIRMGLATEDQVDGAKFKSSTNLSELPQIIILNKTIEVSPFWGEDEVCQVGITRMDFDLTTEANVNIQPTAIFMGSLMSSSEKTALKPKELGRARRVTGQLCKMIAGPGEIIALRQTIDLDANGLPIIERAKLENGGKVIDGDGAWLTDLPMNLDYVYTDEYGNQVISNDPKVGIPTKSKYRFKIKWQQSRSLSEDYKRGYYLVPNIREKGWDTGFDPRTFLPTSIQYKKYQSSYAFSYDWSAYTWDINNITTSNPDISDAINCVDTFYEFQYNKVYTVSMFMDNFRAANARQRFLAIKNIDDDGCDNTVNRYPVNDAYFNASIIWRILNILIIMLSYVLFPLLFLYHLVAWLWNVLLSKIATILTLGLVPIGKMKGFKLPMITYPDCETCDCGPNVDYEESNGGASSCKCYKWTYSKKRKWRPIAGSFLYKDCDGNPKIAPIFTFANQATTNFCASEQPKYVFSPIVPLVYWSVDWSQADCCETINPTPAQLPTYPTNTQTIFENPMLNLHEYQTFQQNNNVFNNLDNQQAQILAGYSDINSSSYGLPISNIPSSLTEEPNYYSKDLPYGERINLFNLKSSYYEGTNQISVQWYPAGNPGKFHLDNVMVFIVKPNTPIFVNNYVPGKMFTFVDIESSFDINVTGGTQNIFGTNNISGSTIYPAALTITYSDPNDRNGVLTQNYVLPPYTNPQNSLYIYPSDIEYFQIIASYTINDFLNLPTGGANPQSLNRIIDSQTQILRTGLFPSSSTVDIVEHIDKDSIILICQRGVDPYSKTYETKIGLGKLLGLSDYSDYEETVFLRLNIPIQASQDPQNRICFQHDLAIDNQTPQYGLNLFYPSYCFTPDTTQYTSYSTNLLGYYSSMDYDLNYQIDPTSDFLQDPQITNRGSYNSSLEVWSTSSNFFYSSALRPRKYQDYESVVGGSYMYFEQLLGLGGYFKALNYSKIYDLTTNINMNSSTNIIVRADRLPSGDSYESDDVTMLLQQNNQINIYFQTSGSQVYSSGTTGTGGAASTATGGLGGVTPDNQDDIGPNSGFTDVLSSFDCNGLAQLDCYQGNGFNFYVDSACAADDHVENGCYVFMKNYKFEPWNGTGPILDFFKYDAKNFFEYFYRFRLNFALCQDVFGTMFHNNWINGNLFAFPFKVNTYFDNQNQVYDRVYPAKVVILHDETNNFYYRSSPYDDIANNFVGVNIDSVYKGGNLRNVRYPTTIMDLGPKYKFLSQIVLSKQFDGYNMDLISSTSYNDLSDLINLFVISRTFNPSFLTLAFGVGQGSITNFYSRPSSNIKYYIDGDAAQSMAINSQLGVIPLDDSRYSTTPPPSQVIITGINPSDVVMGVFFSSSQEDIQSRDYVSPRRRIIGQNPAGTWVYEYIPTNSQEVPNYKWSINSGTIFGNQYNDWDFTLLNGSFYKQKYQEMDRINTPYIGTNVIPVNDDLNYTGYLTDKNNNPLNTPLRNNSGIVGAPWYFYFGLMKGKTAMNLFYTKYIGENILNEQ